MLTTGTTIRLTAREFQVVALLLDGLTYRQIGRRLGIHEKTVNAHVQAIAARIPGSGRPLTRIVRHADTLTARWSPGMPPLGSDPHENIR